MWSPVAVAVTALVLALAIAGPRWNAGTPRLKPDTSATVRLQRDTSSEVRLKPDTTYGKDTKVVEAATTNRSDVVSAFPPSRRFGEARGSAETGGGSRTVDPIDAVALADRMEPLESSPIPVAPLGVDAMDTTEAIAVPSFAVSPLDVPALAIALLDVPVLAEQ